MIKVTAVDTANRTYQLIVDQTRCQFVDTVGVDPEASDSVPIRARCVLTSPFGQFFITETIDEIWAAIYPGRN